MHYYEVGEAALKGACAWWRHAVVRGEATALRIGEMKREATQQGYNIALSALALAAWLLIFRHYLCCRISAWKMTLGLLIALPRTFLLPARFTAADKASCRELWDTIFIFSAFQMKCCFRRWLHTFRWGQRGYEWWCKSRLLHSGLVAI